MKIVVHYSVNGDIRSKAFYDRNIHACIRYVRMKNPGSLFRGTTTSEFYDKCLPPVPEGFEFEYFPVKLKRGPFGRLVNAL